MVRLTRENANNFIGQTISFVSKREKQKVILEGVTLTEKSCSLKVDFPDLNNNLLLWHHKKSSYQRKVTVE